MVGNFAIINVHSINLLLESSYTIPTTIVKYYSKVYYA